MTPRRRTPARTRRRSNVIPVIVILLIVVVGGAWYLARPQEEHVALGGETRVPLSPELFTGVVARAYTVANQHPDLLDSLYCYCFCQENMGHRSLLTCYVDQHAASCGVCMEEAIVAKMLLDKGYTIKEIREYIDKKFGS